MREESKPPVGPGFSARKKDLATIVCSSLPCMAVVDQKTPKKLKGDRDVQVVYTLCT